MTVIRFPVTGEAMHLTMYRGDSWAEILHVIADDLAAHPDWCFHSIDNYIEPRSGADMRDYIFDGTLPESYLSLTYSTLNPDGEAS